MPRDRSAREPRSGTHRLRREGTGARAAATPASRWNRLLRAVRDRWQRALHLDALWIAVFVLVGTWALAPGRQWSVARDAEVGSVAQRDFTAPHDALVLDREATAAKQRRAREEVLPVYDLDPAAAPRLVQELERLFAVGSALPEANATQIAARLQAAGVGLRVSHEALDLLRRRDWSPELLDELHGAVEQVLSRGVVAGKNVLLESRGRGIRVRNLATGQEVRQLDVYGYLDYPDEVRENLAMELRGWGGLPAGQRAVLLDLLVQNIAPNLHLNQSETLRREETAATGVEQVYNRIRKGQILVRKGDPIDAAAATLIAELAGGPGAGARLLPLLGTLLLLSGVALLLWMALRRRALIARARPTQLGEALILLLGGALGTRLSALLAFGLGNAFDTAPFDQGSAYLFAVPFAALALVAVALYTRGTALLLALCGSLLVGVIVEEGSWALPLFAIITSLAAILSVDHFQFRQRSVMLRAGVVVGMVGVASVLMLAAIGGGEPHGAALALRLLCALAGGILTAGVASFLIPVLESAFSITTGIKLVELANTNLPLLRKLAFEAPGTFQHSLMVANLSKAGCDAIGADSVLAYTGALYHDIGKIYRPEYFIENQRPGENRHDRLQPSMSALILIAHVKDGLELAAEHHLPEPVHEAIAQHHGTRLINYFFSRAKEQHDPQSGELLEEKYRYPGPRPRSKPMGVLMLADAVEAACRSLADPSPAKLRTVIRTITEDCLRDGQLDETDLTLGDLARIGEAFQHVLAHIHHRRVDYPGFDFNARRQERGVAAAAAAAETDAPATPAADAPAEPPSAVTGGGG